MGRKSGSGYGASAGIGAAISEKLVDAGCQVIGLARRVEKIEELSKKLTNRKGKLRGLKTDISNEGDILAAFKWIKENAGAVHILINNAGIANDNTLYSGDTEKWRKVMDVNVIGLCIATREAIKSMQENKIDGHIVHVNSIAGHRVFNIPSFNIYPASKHAVTALTESLRIELNSIHSKIKITSVSPGATETELTSVANLSTNDESLVKAFAVMLNAEDIADGIIYALSTPPHVQVHELTIKPVNEAF